METQMSWAAGKDLSCWRYSSRILLFMALRPTAPATLRLTETAKRLYGRSLRKKYKKKTVAQASCFFKQAQKILLLADSLAGRKSAGHLLQALNLRRPFLLLLLRILRPPLVAMRARKPWFFFLFRLLGWKVRFTLPLLPITK